MHDTALSTGETFFRLYGRQFGSGRRVLDVGSRDVNGTLRPYAGAGKQGVPAPRGGHSDDLAANELGCGRILLRCAS